MSPTPPDTLARARPAPRLGFFSRLLDEVPAGERYRLVTEQIAHAEAQGFDSAWIAQHHFHESEGGLPSPFVFLSHVAARTRRIRLGTGVVTLPLENALRVAEDAAVLDLLSNGRLEVGLGTGGTAESFEAFGVTGCERGAVFARNFAVLRDAWAGRELAGGVRLYPAAPQLLERVWQATFSVEGGARAGANGDGLMLSRTQPRPEGRPRATLSEIQNPSSRPISRPCPQDAHRASWPRAPCWLPTGANRHCNGPRPVCAVRPSVMRPWPHPRPRNGQRASIRRRRCSSSLKPMTCMWARPRR